MWQWDGTKLVISKAKLFSPFTESFFVREMPNCILFGYHQDFGEFMRENRLTPFLEPRYKIDGSLEIPLERAKDQLEKHTRYWPMIISQTTIFNMQAVSNLGCVNFCSVPRLCPHVT